MGFHVALGNMQSTTGIVAFDRVLSNFGHGWDDSTAIIYPFPICVCSFKAPTKGLYYITLTVMNQGTSTAWAYLRRGSTNLQIARADGGHSYNVGTTSTVLLLNAGESISAQFGRGNLYSDQNLYTHLAGLLIQRR